MPNACADADGKGHPCKNREQCWEAFGNVSRVGLYPYNDTALRREVTKDGTALTPRTLVDRTVKAFLIEAEVPIATGTFPTEATKDRFDFRVSRSRDAIVPAGSVADADRERLHRCRVIWADGGTEAHGVTVAFDLPVAAGPGRAPTPPPPTPGHVSAAPVPRPLDPLFAWQNGQELPEAEAVWYREHLAILVRSRIDLGELLIDGSGGRGKLLLDNVLRPNSFELANAPGQRAGQDRLRFVITPDDAGVLLLSAVRWWWDHSHWDVKSAERKWDFEADAQQAQLALDEFLSSGAKETEAVIVTTLLRGTLDPAAAAVALRACALRAIGRGPRSQQEGALLDWPLVTVSANDIRPSSAWQEVARVSLLTLQEVDLDWVAAFASARQGAAGEPLSVDAARLAPAMARSLQNPLGMLATAPEFDASFAEISLSWERLASALRDGVLAEAAVLRDTIDTITRSSTPRTSLPWSTW